MSMSKLESARCKILRWRVLKTLDAGRPLPLGEGLLLEVINDCDLAVTRTQLLRALQYLTEKGYCRTRVMSHSGQGQNAEASLTAQGIDFVDYNLADDVGIARPKPL